MKRRSFLQKSILGAAALTLPAWLGCAFGSKSEWAFDDEDFQQGSTLAAAYLRAQKLGKPLLVWVVPPYPYPKDQLNNLSQAEREKVWAVSTLRDERGHAFGELLNHGTEAQRWPLALCEVVCALPIELEYLTGSSSGTPLMALLETDSPKPAPAIPFDAALPSYRELEQIMDSWEAMQQHEERAILERIALLAKLVKEAIAPDDETITRRAKQARAALTKEQKAIEKKLNAKSLTAPESDVIAALVAESAAKSKAAPRLYSLLAQAADARLCKLPVEGSRWGRASGCGTTYEAPPKPKSRAPSDGGAWGEASEEMTIIGCGMGHVPAKSQRFIDFYLEESV